MSSNAYVYHPIPDIMYIIVDEWATFEALPGPDSNGGACRAKEGKWNGVNVIFQYFGLPDVPGEGDGPEIEPILSND